MLNIPQLRRRLQARKETVKSRSNLLSCNCLMAMIVLTVTSAYVRSSDSKECGFAEWINGPAQT